MSDCVENCNRLIEAALQTSETARFLLDAIKMASAGKEKVEIECVRCEDNSKHVAIYDRSGERPSVQFIFMLTVTI